VFALEQRFIDASGVPSAAWLNQLAPQRDAAKTDFKIEPLRLPTSVKSHPILGRVFKLKAVDTGQTNFWTAKLNAATGVEWAELAPVRTTCDISANRSSVSHKVKSDRINALDAPPDDPLYPQQWALRRILADAAWDIARGDTNVCIAVVDVGVDIDHGDLISKRWLNRGEAAGWAGVDDDGNGFVDDLFGWDFQSNDNNPRPEANDDHGTIVAGIAAAATDNGYGIAGIGWNCRIMPVRTGAGRNINYGYEGLIYAAAAGAQIINLSWGSDHPLHIERIATEYAVEAGAVVVAAAGNADIRTAPYDHYPGGYPSVIAVAMTDDRDRMSRLSNYNIWVDISAPGKDILSLLPGNRFGLASGTSMATPVVAGAAALVKSLHPDWTPIQIKQQLERTADRIDHLNSHIDSLGKGRLNLYRALADEPSVMKIAGIAIEDALFGNNNGFPDPGERVGLIITLANNLTRPQTTALQIKPLSYYLTIDESLIELGLVRPNDFDIKVLEPLPVRISANAPSGVGQECSIDLILDGQRFERANYTIEVRPNYIHHRGGNISFTLTDFGAIGWDDYPVGKRPGIGFRYPADGLSGLSHGSLLVGVERARVSDNCFGDAQRTRYDFRSSQRGFAVQSDDYGNETSVAVFTDAAARPPLELQVKQNAWTFSHPPDDGYAIIVWTVYNLSPNRYDSLYVALFLDWDIVRFDKNFCHWDSAAQVGWMEYQSASAPRFGAAVINTQTDFQTAVSNSLFDYRWSDTLKSQSLRKGFSEAESSQRGDWAQLIGIGPRALDPDDSLIVAFALAGGQSENVLKNYIHRARQRWQDLAPINIVNSQPSQFRLLSLYPQPFNGFLRVACAVNAPGLLKWRLLDAAGRRMPYQGRQYILNPEVNFSFQTSGLPSGFYLLELTNGYQTLMAPIILMR